MSNPRHISGRHGPVLQLAFADTARRSASFQPRHFAMLVEHFAKERTRWIAAPPGRRGGGPWALLVRSPGYFMLSAAVNEARGQSGTVFDWLTADELRAVARDGHLLVDLGWEALFAHDEVIAGLAEAVWKLGVDPARIHLLHCNHAAGPVIDRKWPSADPASRIHDIAFPTSLALAVAFQQRRREPDAEAVAGRLAAARAAAERGGKPHRLNFLNGEPRSQRLLVACHLLREGLLEGSLVSMLGYSKSGKYKGHDTAEVRALEADKLRALAAAVGAPELAEGIEELLARLPLTLDVEAADLVKTPDRFEEVAWSSPDPSIYDRSWFSIADTLFFDDEILFVTEKALKPIMNASPFVYFGNPGGLDLLRGWGFEFAPGLFDPAYDALPGHAARLKAALAEASAAARLPDAELRARCLADWPRVEHNYRNFWDGFGARLGEAFRTAVIDPMCGAVASESDVDFDILDAARIEGREAPGAAPAAIDPGFGRFAPARIAKAVSRRLQRAGIRLGDGSPAALSNCAPAPRRAIRKSGRELRGGGMLTAKNWARIAGATRKPWLILGKGPSFRKYRPDFAGQYHVMALNHVAREVACDVALMMDIDVFEACGEEIAANAKYLMLPWRPHIDLKPTDATLLDLLPQMPRLRDLANEDRLVIFNAETARNFEPFPGEPVTPIKFFSAEAGLNVLADNGVREIRTLGVDGGATYADSFRDLNDVTLLINGRDNFDRQFRMFAQTLRRHPNIKFGPLPVQTPVRIFIGADETQILGAKLFEYSVRRHASMSVKCEIINNDGLPTPTDPNRRARTGFSFCRFKIPQLCNHRGRAVYVDADMQVFTDIKDLWTRDFNDAWLLYSELPEGSGARVPQYSVMLLNCDKLDWNAHQLVTELDQGKYEYKQLMADFAMMPPEKKQPLLEFEWNSLEHYEEGRTKLVHYTDMPTQPWVSDQNKHGEVWYAELRRAVADGFVTIEEIHAEIDKGHVSPLLPNWAKLEPHPRARQLAQNWTPPFRRFQRPKAAA
jgi:hypothetical protein